VRAPVDGEPAPPRHAVLLGRGDEFQATAYLRLLAVPEGLADPRVEGTFRGPRCRHAATLPASARLEPLPAAGAVPPAAAAVLVEPGFWSPQLPHRYELEARLVDGGREICRWSRMVGFRRLGIRGQSFWLENRRWVPRAIVANNATTPLAAYRKAGACPWLPMPAASLLDEADAEGVMVVAELVDSCDDPLEALLEWAGHPSVGFAVAAPELLAVASAARRSLGTMLLGSAVDGASEAAEALRGVPAAADFVVLDLPAGGVPHDSWQSGQPRPIVVRRRDPAHPGKREPDRQHCDHLQADLAGWLSRRQPAWDPAGYATGTAAAAW